MEESRNDKTGATGSFEDYLLHEKSNFRKKCFAKQLALLRPLISHIIIPAIIAIFYVAAMDLFPLSSCFLFGGAMLSWTIALVPGVIELMIKEVKKRLFSGDQSEEGETSEADLSFREGISFLAMAGHILIFHFANTVNTDHPAIVRAEALGHHGCLMKLGLMCLHYSDFHFLFLHLLDTLVHLFFTFTVIAPAAGPVDGPEICKIVLIQSFFIGILVIKYREVVKVTIGEAYQELILREKAEKGRKSFMSYIMHEMRNPLSGASLLVSEFQSVLKEVLSVAQNCASTGGRVTRRKLLRLLRLAALLSGQMDKMRGVCDDVLQMEKLDRGGFEFVFSSQDVRTWFEDVTAQMAPLFGEPVSGLIARREEDSEKNDVKREGVRGSTEDFGKPSSQLCSSGDEDAKGPSLSLSRPATAVRFSPAFEVSPEIERQMETHSVGVADFRRLEQVLGNFASNARKFTKRGEVRVEAELRAPSEEERKNFLSLLSIPAVSSASPTKRTSPSSRTGSTGDSGQRLSFSSNEKAKLSAAPATRQWREAIRELQELQKHEENATSIRRLRWGDPLPAEERVSEENEGEGGKGPLPCAVLRVSVRDTGPGLRKEEIQQLFKPYSQIRSGELQNGGGTGLGLCICKSFVEAHGGGEIGVESEGPDKGSTFFFQLFLPLVRGARKVGGSSAELDSPTAPGGGRTGGKGISTMADLYASVATPRRKRLTRTAEERLGNGFIFADFGSSASGDNLTRGSFEESTSKTQEDSGSQQDTTAETPPCFSDPSSPPVYEADVLLVDDDQFCLLAGKAAIKRLGYSVKTASDGDEAVDLLVRRRMNFRLVLMDNNMARMNGPEAMQQIRDHFAQSLQRKKQKEGASKREGGGGNKSGQGDAKNEKEDGGCGEKTCSSPPLSTQSVPLLLGCTGDIHCDDTFLKAGAARVIHKPLRAAELSETLQSLRRQSLSLSRGSG
uniref:histidine kinase n=1 Tax=Chromera velia CCMP2878 TaxID=1169474 RepID=A0A0G4HCJ5_9ALVE|eukprot:Cvel_26197.t1-p1 / transcript=Cvel_26197.t1 / gene=Cvel_26197 / organism=Chromera_velia_CCMP2878 / gene_product=hypothetical protein / transcript_product=hypothetical protein / location=Cvel_scaffold3082:13614-18001(-) / protein_length=957 / sequence_SO=supercontig / SO=protein_coding / is_pseudo=false